MTALRHTYVRLFTVRQAVHPRGVQCLMDDLYRDEVPRVEDQRIPLSSITGTR